MTIFSYKIKIKERIFFILICDRVGYCREWDVVETLAESRYWKRQVGDLNLHAWNLRHGDCSKELGPVNCLEGIRKYILHARSPIY